MKVQGRILFILFTFVLPVSGWAYGGGDMAHLLSIGAGISSPSMTSALGENPAGLIYNQDTRFLGAVGTENSSFNPLGIGAGIFAGNGQVGAAVNYQEFNNLSKDNGGSIHLLEFGLAADIQSLNIAFGANGTYTISQSGSVEGTGAGSTLGIDAGIIYNPKGQTRFGVTAYQLQNSVEAFGAGIATDLNPNATFSLDGTSDKSLNGKIIKPTLAITLSDFQMVYGYGLKLDDHGSPWIREGSAVGLGLRVNPNIQLEFYYNQLAAYYLGILIKI